MRRSVAAGTITAAATAAVALRGPMKAHLAEGTLPGRLGSRINSYGCRPLYRLIAGALDLESEDDLLDVACGWGEFLVVHGSQARGVAGIDRSQEKVALARERLADRIAAGTGEVAHGDAAEMPWDDNTFSAVTCMDAFPFFPDPHQVLTEILRVLRPGGRMVMQIGMRWPDGPPKRIMHPTSHVDVSDEDVVRKLVEGAGFSDLSISYGPAGLTRVGNFASRLMVGSDETRIIGAVKPQEAVDR
jgi:SAM-dependent methyltransferase